MSKNIYLSKGLDQGSANFFRKRHIEYKYFRAATVVEKQP